MVIPSHIYESIPPFYFYENPKPEIPNKLCIGFTSQGNAGKQFEWYKVLKENINKTHCIFLSSGIGGGFYGGPLGGPFNTFQSGLDTIYEIIEQFNIEICLLFGSSAGGGGALSYGKVLSNNLPVCVNAFSPRFHPQGFPNTGKFFANKSKYMKDSEYHIHYDPQHGPDIPHVEIIKDFIIEHNYPGTNHNTSTVLSKNGTLLKIINEALAF